MVCGGQQDIVGFCFFLFWWAACVFLAERVMHVYATPNEVNELR